jgi:hypothetical protein
MVPRAISQSGQTHKHKIENMFLQVFKKKKKNQPAKK